MIKTIMCGSIIFIMPMKIDLLADDLQHLQDLSLGLCACGLADDLAFLDDHERWNRHDLIGGGQLGLLIHVDLAYLDIAALFCDFIHNG